VDKANTFSIFDQHRSNQHISTLPVYDLALRYDFFLIVCVQIQCNNASCIKMTKSRWGHSALVFMFWYVRYSGHINERFPARADLTSLYCLYLATCHSWNIIFTTISKPYLSLTNYNFCGGLCVIVIVVAVVVVSVPWLLFCLIVCLFDCLFRVVVLLLSSSVLFQRFELRLHTSEKLLRKIKKQLQTKLSSPHPISYNYFLWTWIIAREYSVIICYVCLFVIIYFIKCFKSIVFKVFLLLT